MRKRRSGSPVVETVKARRHGDSWRHHRRRRVGAGTYTGPMASVRPWPKLAEEDQRLIERMEERFEKTSKSPEQLRARAKELYAEAEHAEPGRRDALLALADRYEATAEARLTRR